MGFGGTVPREEKSEARRLATNFESLTKDSPSFRIMVELGLLHLRFLSLRYISRLGVFLFMEQMKESMSCFLAARTV